MPISFRCPHCGHATQVAEQFAGQTGPCVQCGRQVTIPAATNPVPGTMSDDDATPPARSRSTLAIFAIIAVLGVLSCIGLGVVGALIFPAINGARERARQATCLHQMRGNAVVLGGFDLQTGSYPPSRTAVTAEQPTMSWRVVILPLQEQSTLFDQYHRSEPWNSEHNSTLATPQILYLCPSDAANYSPPRPFANTTVVNGESCIFNGPRQIASGVVSRSDGLGQTILLNESIRAEITWTEPRDLEFEQVIAKVGQPDAQFDSWHPDGINVIFADLHGEAISRKIDPDVLKALLTFRGGETVPNDR